MLTNWQSLFLVSFAAGFCLAVFGAARLRVLGGPGKGLIAQLEGLLAKDLHSEASERARGAWPSLAGEVFEAALCGRAHEALATARSRAGRALAVAVVGGLLPLAGLAAGVHRPVQPGELEAPATVSAPLSLPRLAFDFHGDVLLVVLVIVPVLIAGLALRRYKQIHDQLGYLEQSTPRAVQAAQPAGLPSVEWGTRIQLLVAGALAGPGAWLIGSWWYAQGRLMARAANRATVGFGLVGLAVVAASLAVLGSPVRGCDRRVAKTGWAAHIVLLACGPDFILAGLGVGLFERDAVPALVGATLYFALIVAIGTRHLLVDPVGRRILRWRGPLGLLAKATVVTDADTVGVRGRMVETKNSSFMSYTVRLERDPPIELGTWYESPKAEAQAATARLLLWPTGAG